MKALLLAAALGAAGLTVVAAPAHAAAIGQCTTTRGTIVAVDFGHFGGPIVRGCGVTSSGQPDASGYALLHDGGFTTTGTSHDGPAFICRLGNAAFSSGTQYPTAAQESCNATPPASAYWSYWLAEPGSEHWHYSDYGAMADKPVAGEVQLWRFGGTNVQGSSGDAVPPDSLIDQLRAQNTTVSGTSSSAPARQSSAPAAAGPTALARTAAPAAGQPGATVPRRAPSAARSPAAPSSSAAVAHATSAVPSASPTSRPALIVAARDAPPPTAKHGSPYPLIGAGVLVAALLGGGGLTVWRRRQNEG